MATTIERILQDAANQGRFPEKTKESINWFMKTAKSAKVNSSQLVREYGSEHYRSPSQISPGNLYMYHYDPKWKEELPYYDLFPCVFIIGPAGAGKFAALNLHYLSYAPRAKLLDALLDLENSAKVPKNKKLAISYNILKSASSLSLFKPCYKHYLNKHVRSRLLRVPHEEWIPAAFLPCHDFEKATAQKVWRESMKIAKK